VPVPGSTCPVKPAHVFDRSAEWDALAAFASRSLPHAMLGIVSGRRRMGKTYLLAVAAFQRHIRAVLPAVNTGPTGLDDHYSPVS
jgi:hypothetical protein